MSTLLSSTEVFSSARFKVERVTYRLPGDALDGKPLERDVIRHPGAVVILPIDEAGNLIFLSQFRVALNAEMIELPAGTKAQEETPMDCAKRELAEEAGIAALSWVSMGIIYPAPGLCDEQQHLFVARQHSPYKLPADSDERITVQRLTPSEVMQMLGNGKLQDSKSVALLFRARLAALW